MIATQQAASPSRVRVGRGRLAGNDLGSPSPVAPKGQESRFPSIQKGASFNLDEQTLGKKPILAAGNVNGDLHMLQYMAGQKQPAMALPVHHTDAEREYRFAKHAEKVLPLAEKGGWTLIDMKKDWKTGFPTK